MNLSFYSNDEMLYKNLVERSLFEKVEIINSLEKSYGEALLISDSFLEYSDLINVSFEKHEIVYYLLRNSYHPQLEKNVKAICDSKDIILIPSRLVEEQIINVIEASLNPYKDKLSNVFSFFSPIGNVGTTSTCLSVGNALQKSTNARIGVLLLNAWDDGTDHLEYKGSYLNEIKPKIAGKLINTEDEFLSLFHMEVKDSLYILGGNQNTRMERLYTKEEINYLIEKARQSFDVVLIDTGSHFDNAIMVQSLVESNLKFLVLNQQSKAIKKYNQIFNNVLYPLGYQDSDFLMIINQYEDKPHFPNSKDIYKEINIPMLTTIERNEYGIQAEREQKMIYTYNDVVYNESINIVAKTIAGSINLEIIQTEFKKKKRFLSR